MSLPPSWRSRPSASNEDPQLHFRTEARPQDPGTPETLGAPTRLRAAATGLGRPASLPDHDLDPPETITYVPIDDDWPQWEEPFFAVD